MENFFVATNVRFLLIIVLPFWLFHGVGSVVVLVIALSLFAHLKVNCGFHGKVKFGSLMGALKLVRTSSK